MLRSRDRARSCIEPAVAVLYFKDLTHHVCCSATRDVLIKEYDAIRALQRCNNGIRTVKGQQRLNIDHFHFDAYVGKLGSCIKGYPTACAIGHDRDMMSLTDDLGYTKRYPEVGDIGWKTLLQAVSV